MSNEYRLKAIKEIASEAAGANMPAAPASLDFYGEDVFNAEAMRAYLPKDICKKLFATIDEGAPLDASIAYQCFRSRRGSETRSGQQRRYQ